MATSFSGLIYSRLARCSCSATLSICCVAEGIMQQRALKSYLFYGQTQSLCETCLHPVPAKILIEDDRVYFQKRCDAHGVQKTLVSTDADYYRQCRDWLKPEIGRASCRERV